ncbi:HlyD family efflux transporter periplasmic adaptor subunit [candidate division KSB1 bacterium]|nr:HlyD family efflux transporter periplasmic adaptor subunit [candidate division KSB1 bacterium]RQW04372.1 MAG: HlyD family efflux transporter periplasmic adaptor subunit [candidate division KSB1 bacterium]
MKKRQFIIVGSLVLLFVIGFALMQFLAAQREDLPRRTPDAGDRWVKAESVSYATIKSKVINMGRVVSTEEVEVIAEATGKIEPGSVDLKKSERFRKGDTLLVIYKDEVELALKAQKSHFLTTVANLLPDIKIDFPDKYDAFLAFFNSINIDRDFPVLPDIQSEKMKIFLASRNVLNEYYSIKQAEKQLERHTITAPFAGTFAEVHQQVGAFTGMGVRIASIIRTDALEVEVLVDQDQAPFIRVGDPVTLHSDKRHLDWNGTVVRVSDFVDLNTQARSIFVRVPLDRQAPLYRNEYLIAEFGGMTIPDAMEIPRNAVFNSDVVFTVEEGRLKKRQVEIVKFNVETVVFRGLPEGVFVVVQPLINVAENTPVKILGVDSVPEQPQDTNQSIPQIS